MILTAGVADALLAHGEAEKLTVTRGNDRYAVADAVSLGV